MENITITRDEFRAILLESAHLGARSYAESHPRPVMVTQKEGAETMGISIHTFRKLIKDGVIHLNSAGLVPMSEIDKAIAVRGHNRRAMSRAAGL